MSEGTLTDNFQIEVHQELISKHQARPGVLGIVRCLGCF